MILIMVARFLSLTVALLPSPADLKPLAAQVASMDEQVKATTADAHKMRDYIKDRIRVHDEDEAHQRVTIDFLQVRECSSISDHRLSAGERVFINQ